MLRSMPLGMTLMMMLRTLHNSKICLWSCATVALSGLDSATASLNVAAVFQDLGFIDPKKAKLRIPYHFVPPDIQPQAVANAKSKPKPNLAPRQLSMNASVA